MYTTCTYGTIIHFGNNEQIVLVIDGSGSQEEDRKCFYIQEKRLQILLIMPLFGKEVISAYWFDGYESSLIYDLVHPLHFRDYNQFSDGLSESRALLGVGIVILLWI